MYVCNVKTPLIPVALSAEAKNGGDSSSRVRLYYQVSIKIFQLPNWRKNKVKNGGQIIKFWICYSRRKDTRKIAAQKFYSLLVLQKVCVLILHFKRSSCFNSPPHCWNIPLVQFMAVELAQDDACYGRMQVSRGKQVEWQYGGKSVVKLLELAIWCRVWCLLRTVCHLSISKDCFLFQFELDTSKVKANWDSVFLQVNTPPASKWSINGESESDNLV